MDKHVFFDSQCFLKNRAFDDPDWPPQLGETCSVQQLMINFKLSVEIPGRGPIALKVGEGEDDDPTMFRCDMILLEHKGTSQNSTDNDDNSNDETMIENEISVPSNNELSTKENENHQEIILRIQNSKCNPYRIDLRRITKPPELSKGRVEPGVGKVPRSILLHFGKECIFRFFCDDETNRLQNIHEILKGVSRMAPDHQERVDDGYQTVKRKLATVQDGWKETVDFFLFQTDEYQQQSIFDKKASKKLNESVSSLLYASPLEVQHAIEYIDEKLEKIDEKIENLSLKYFPPSKPSKQNRNDTPSNANHMQIEIEDAVNKLENLMNEKCRFLEEKHNLSFLPIKE